LPEEGGIVGGLSSQPQHFNLLAGRAGGPERPQGHGEVLRHDLKPGSETAVPSISPSQDTGLEIPRPAKQRIQWRPELLRHPDAISAGASDQPPLGLAPGGQKVQHVATSVFNGVFIHNSHMLWFKRGVVWCSRCGGWSIATVKLLNEPCRNGLTRQGKEVLHRMRKGETPNVDVIWPQRPGDPPPQGIRMYNRA
jgi:hypothetical protein